MEKHRRSQESLDARAPPRAEKISFSGPNLQGNVVSAFPRQRVHPEAEQKSNFF